jgi:hypothetical protein
MWMIGIFGVLAIYIYVRTDGTVGLAYCYGAGALIDFIILIVFRKYRKRRPKWKRRTKRRK